MSYSSRPIINNSLVGHTIEVDSVNGNDATALTAGKYDLTKPFLTIAAAIAVASSPDKIHIRAGTYTVTTFIVPIGVTLEGDGIDVTILNSAALLSTGCIVGLSTNS